LAASALAASLAVAACTTIDPQVGSAATAGDTLIQISPGACFGACPMYDVSVDRSDRIDFRPQRFTKVEAPVVRQGQVGTFERVAALVAPLRPAATGDHDVSQQCDNVITDLPDYHVRWTGTDGVRTVRFYPGCENAATADTQRRIDAALREYRIDDLVKRDE